METSIKALRKGNCPRCKSPLAYEFGVFKCLSCGFEKSSNKSRALFFADHKAEIIQDLLNLGSKATRNKWQIPSATLCGLRKRWGVGLPPPAAGNGSQVPELPQFSNDWDPAVQQKWLSIWERLKFNGGEK